MNGCKIQRKIQVQLVSNEVISLQNYSLDGKDYKQVHDIEDRIWKIGLLFNEGVFEVLQSFLSSTRELVSLLNPFHYSEVMC